MLSKHRARNATLFNRQSRICHAVIGCFELKACDWSISQIFEFQPKSNWKSAPIKDLRTHNDDGNQYANQTTNCLTLLETSSEWRALVHPHLDVDTIIQIFNLDDVPDAVVDQLLPLAVACMFTDDTICTNDTHPLATTMLSAHDDDSVAKIAAFLNRLYLSDEWIRVRGNLPRQEAAGSLFSQAKNLLPLTAMNADVRHACDAPKTVRVYQSHMSRYCNPKESLSKTKPPPIPRDA
ncbi:hypothetical protein LEN26_008975 [Aphanomyces euteiches]|nr:hypothetical protein LEN26_008975 [Aphanomyces euteiches]